MRKLLFFSDRWCLLEFDYHFNVLSLFLNIIDSDSIPINNVNKEDVIDSLKELERVAILDQCFEYFFTPQNGKTL